MNNQVIEKLARNARKLSLALNDDFNTLSTYAERGNGDMAILALRTAQETMANIQDNIDAIQRQLGIRLGQIINMKV